MPRPRRVSITRYLDAQDRRVAKGAPGARAVRVLSETWYVTLTIDGKRRTVSLGTTNEGAAWVELRRIEREGLTPAVRPKATTLTQHADDWHDSLMAAGGNPNWCGQVRHRVCHLADLAGWAKLSDVTRDSAAAALAKLVAAPLSLAPQTRNHYLSHLRQFLRWCLETDRLTRNPILGLKPVRVDHDVRRRRRVPTADEVVKLFAYLATAKARRRRGMSGPQRALGYRVAMACGLRKSEVQSLTRHSFDLERGVVTLHAAYDKAGRLAEQPLPPWLVGELREWFAAGGECWPRFGKHLIGAFRADLAAAGVEYSTVAADGRTKEYFDFHSLRHWYVTEIVSQPDMDMKTAMSLTRHSTPALVLKIYARAKEQKRRRAADAIPEPGAQPENPRLRAEPNPAEPE